MSKLKDLREQQNLTQEELATRTKLSVRTIQRIEAGNEPKGHTLKILAEELKVNPSELITTKENPENSSATVIKLINLSSIPGIFFPPFNIILPLILIRIKHQFSPLTKQIVTLQILWFLGAIFIFMGASLLKNWYSLSSKFIFIVMIILALSNLFLILRNAIEIDKKGKIYFQLNFSLI